MFDSQEYKDILDNQVDEDDPDNDDTLRDLLSNRDFEADVNQGVLEQAEIDALKSGYDISHLYRIDGFGDADQDRIDIREITDNEMNVPAAKAGYDGYLIGDDFAPNGASFGRGIEFPKEPEFGDYFLRTDFLPNRLFKFDGAKWIRVHDNVRMTMTNSEDRQTQKTKFVNEKEFVYNELDGYDSVILEEGDTIIETDIDNDSTDAPYLVLKYGTFEKSYVIEDFPDLIQSNSKGKIEIHLPVKSGVQDSINYSGQWDVKFYVNREPMRQALSQVLRPKADR